MDQDGAKSKYSHWRSNTNTKSNTNSLQSFPSTRYDPHRYSKTTDLQSTLDSITQRHTNTNANTNTQKNTSNKYSVDINRLLSHSNSTTFPSHNITTTRGKYKHTYQRPKNNENDNKSNQIITDKYKNKNLSANTNKYILQTNNKVLSKNNNNNKNRITDTPYNLSLIRPSDKVVLYSPIAGCYVCLSDFEDSDTDTVNDDMKLKDREYNTDESLYLQCDDMEGVGLLIGEASFTGACKFLADCKIQLITGQGLYKDRNRIIIHRKHATKFMLQKYEKLKDTSSMVIGDKVLIFIEASRSNPKQYWSYNKENRCIVLQELSTDKPTQNEIFILQKYGHPLQLRSNDQIKTKYAYSDMVIDLYNCSHSVQEWYLCHDLLRVLARDNFNGDFVQFASDVVYGFPKIIFTPKKYGIKAMLSSAINALKPLIENTAKVRYFVRIHSRTEYGVISQAFCYEIGKYLTEFEILLVQLETRMNKNELSLQNMRFYLQNSLHTMTALCDICSEIHLNKDKKYKSEMYLGCRGGGLLNMIGKHISISGEKNTRILYNKLMRASQKPYFEMLSQWIYRGIITDIFGEFMIKESKHLKKEDVAQEYNNEYWTSRYSLNFIEIPFFLYDYKDKIVTTGKYLNVMRESGYKWDKTEVLIKPDMDERELGQIISDRYQFASKALLEMLMNKERIMLRFKSIGKYMLLQCSDWFVHFMDMSYQILIASATDIKKTKLDRLLELSIRTSNSTCNDPFKDDVCCCLKSKDLNKMISMLLDKNLRDDKLIRLTGLEAFALNYKVKWPSSIIFTGRNVIRYQLIFRFLFKLKFVIRELSFAWKQQMGLRELMQCNGISNKSLVLRHKMLSFMNNLMFYISYCVIEPNWNTFLTHSYGNCHKTVDSLLSAQETFLTKTLQQCLLTNKVRIELLFKILISCQSFSKFIKRYTSDWKIYETTKHSSLKTNKISKDMLAKDCRDSLLSSNFVNSIEKYNKSFHKSVTNFLNDLQKSNDENIDINLLLSRLDFNAYYMPKLLSF